MAHIARSPPATMTSLLTALEAFVQQLPFYILFGMGVLLFFRRELHTVSLSIGVVANEICNKVLKNVIREPRPGGAERHGYGMPSGHSQFMCFLAAYTIAYLGSRAKFGSEWTSMLSLWLYRITVLIAALSVCISRVIVGEHTTLQVIIGGCLGCLNGLVWYYVILQRVCVAGGLFAYIESLPVCKALLIKDSGNVDNVLKFEYEAHFAARRQGRERTKAQ